MIDHPIGTSIGRMVIDCMGEEPKRELKGDALSHCQVLMTSCPWNFVSKRFHNVHNMLCDFSGMLEHAGHEMRRVYFFYKKGERRSAAVLMVVLCEVYAFSRSAAKYQIEDMRPRASITMFPERAYPASWVDVNEILDAIDAPHIAG